MNPGTRRLLQQGVGPSAFAHPADVVADGRIIGTWRAVSRKQGLTVEWSCFTSAFEAEALQASARRFAEFRGEPLLAVREVD